MTSRRFSKMPSLRRYPGSGALIGVLCVTLPASVLAQSSRDVIAFLNDERMVELLSVDPAGFVDGTGFQLTTSILSDHEATLTYIMDEALKFDPELTTGDLESAKNLLYYYASYPASAYLDKSEDARMQDFTASIELIDAAMGYVCPKDEFVTAFSQPFVETCDLLASRF